VIAKARTYERGFPRFLLDLVTQYQEQGVDYLVALLKGYEQTPQGMQMAPGMMYNKYFPGHGIAMPPPLSDGQIVYDDGTAGTVDQYARDVAAFLAWAAEPHMEARKRLGFQVIVFLIVLSGLLYFTKKRVWREVHANVTRNHECATIEQLMNELVYHLMSRNRTAKRRWLRCA
jgi:ubiquinol-cytochrome c reductase cytochrome b/c1 subunit